LNIVTEFDVNHFQWYAILDGRMVEFNGEKYFFDVSTTQLSEATTKVYEKSHKYWNNLKNADVAFVYCTRTDLRKDYKFEWYMLPVYVKWINPNIKTLVQFDDECEWIFDPRHTWWGEERTPKIRNPEKFIKEKGFLEAGDIYLTVISPEDVPYKRYCSKPIKRLLLPHLHRYAKIAFPIKRTRKIFLLRHSVQSASVQHTLNNVIMPLKIETYLFNTPMNTYPAPSVDLPSFVKKFGLVPRGAMLVKLRECMVSIDDNEGYRGWSRFAMESLLADVPCVGSTPAVKDLFPDLYTKHKDYEKQRELIIRLLNDDKFRHDVLTKGMKLLHRKLSDDYLVKRFLRMILSFNLDFEKITLKQAERINLIKKLRKSGKTPCPPPKEGQISFDPASKKMVDLKTWKKLYGNLTCEEFNEIVRRAFHES